MLGQRRRRCTNIGWIVRVYWVLYTDNACSGHDVTATGPVELCDWFVITLGKYLTVTLLQAVRPTACSFRLIYNPDLFISPQKTNKAGYD